MYSMTLKNGTVISNLEKIKPCTFQMKCDNTQIYFSLTDDNLSLVTIDDEGFPDDIWVDYTLQNFSQLNGIIQFKCAPWEEVHRESNREKRKRSRAELKEGD